jgi:NitT/TauT family transport system substrate-binding protein
MTIRKCSLLLLGLLLAFLGSCSSSSPPLPPLRIAIQSVWPTFGAAFIAQEKGLFAKYGVQVTLIPATGYVESLKPYKEGQADAAFIMFSDTLMLDAEGVPSRLVYATDYSDMGDIIVGSPHLNSLSELKGKKVSIDGFNTFSHLLVLKLLKMNGVNEGEFQLANINDPFKVLEALESGEIQAGHIYGLAATQALAKGYKMMGKAGDIRHLMIDGLAVNAEVIKTRRQEVQGLINALVEAMAWLTRSPEEGLEIVARHTHILKAELETTFKRVHVFTLAENQEVFKADGALFKGGQEIIDFFYQKGVLVKLPDLNAVIDDQFINTRGDKP